MDIRLAVDNTAKDHRVRVMFDTGIKAEFCDAAGHFTVDSRPVTPSVDRNGEFYPEVKTAPQQGFVDLSDGKTGFAVINNCFSEYEAMDNEQRTLAITLFRSVRNIICSEFRSAGVFKHEKGGQSLGLQEYEYSIIPHEGNWEQAGIYAETEKLNVPVKMVQTSAHPGVLPLEQSFMVIQPAGLVMSALKKAEDRESYILRLFNPGSRKYEREILFKPVIREAYLTNLNEERLKQIQVEDGHKLSITAKSNKIITVEIIL